MSLLFRLAWNTGTVMYMVWLAIGCLNQFINSVVWAEDALIRNHIWCDICKYFCVSKSESFC
jgi:pheromone a factor receptor